MTFDQVLKYIRLGLVDVIQTSNVSFQRLPKIFHNKNEDQVFPDDMLDQLSQSNNQDIENAVLE